MEAGNIDRGDFREYFTEIIDAWLLSFGLVASVEIAGTENEFRKYSVHLYYLPYGQKHAICVYLKRKLFCLFEIAFSPCCQICDQLLGEMNMVFLQQNGTLLHEVSDKIGVLK